MNTGLRLPNATEIALGNMLIFLENSISWPLRHMKWTETLLEGLRVRFRVSVHRTRILFKDRRIRRMKHYDVFLNLLREGLRWTGVIIRMAICLMIKELIEHLLR